MNLILASMQPVAILVPCLVAISLLLHFMEHRFTKKWIFMILNGLFFAGGVVSLLFVRATLSELLLFCISVLILRVAFILIEGREKH